MAREEIAKDDLLFHSVHGLCRVAQVTQKVPADETNYLLLPVSTNRAKVRFLIPESSLEESGFGLLISVRAANAILDYFKTGKEEKSGCSQAWKQAELIWSESRSKEPVKDSRRRQRVDRAVKGLAGELAYVLKLTLEEIGGKIQKNLGRISDINPLVLTALTNIEKD
ncbi:MAG: hypothetical protein Q8R76_07750 [Candidatus Omnitrophota bacterium]|nr:hypothetical protein [Candidatus Omnitrophota bacterium]